MNAEAKDFTFSNVLRTHTRSSLNVCISTLLARLTPTKICQETFPGTKYFIILRKLNRGGHDVCSARSRGSHRESRSPECLHLHSARAPASSELLPRAGEDTGAATDGRGPRRQGPHPPQRPDAAESGSAAGVRPPLRCQPPPRRAPAAKANGSLGYPGRTLPTAAAPTRAGLKAPRPPGAPGQEGGSCPPRPAPPYLARGALKSRGPAGEGRLSSCRCERCTSARSPSRYSSTSGAPRASGSGNGSSRRRRRGPPRFFPPASSSSSSSSRGGGRPRSRWPPVARSRHTGGTAAFRSMGRTLSPGCRRELRRAEARYGNGRGSKSGAARLGPAPSPAGYGGARGRGAWPRRVTWREGQGPVTGRPPTRAVGAGWGPLLALRVVLRAGDGRSSPCGPGRASGYRTEAGKPSSAVAGGGLSSRRSAPGQAMA